MWQLGRHHTNLRASRSTGLGTALTDGVWGGRKWWRGSRLCISIGNINKARGSTIPKGKVWVRRTSQLRREVPFWKCSAIIQDKGTENYAKKSKTAEWWRGARAKEVGIRDHALTMQTIKKVEIGKLAALQKDQLRWYIPETLCNIQAIHSA